MTEHILQVHSFPDMSFQNRSTSSFHISSRNLAAFLQNHTPVPSLEPSPDFHPVTSTQPYVQPFVKKDACLLSRTTGLVCTNEESSKDYNPRT